MDKKPDPPFSSKVEPKSTKRVFVEDYSTPGKKRAPETEAGPKEEDDDVEIISISSGSTHFSPPNSPNTSSTKQTPGNLTIETAVNFYKSLSPEDRLKFQQAVGLVAPQLSPHVKLLESGIQFTKPENWDDLLACWQWDWTNGNPIFESTDDDKKFIRYVPEEFADGSRVVKEFINGMKSNKRGFVVTCGDARKYSAGRDERKIFHLLVRFDIKKLKYARSTGNNLVKLTFEKLTADLLPYTDGITALPTMDASSKDYSLHEIKKFWAKDTLYAQVGPGTYYCRDSHCKHQDHVTASPTIDFGNGLTAYCTKRFTCSTKNCVYHIHCDGCKATTTTNYVGSAQDLHGRVTNHLDVSLAGVSYLTKGKKAVTPPQAKEMIENLVESVSRQNTTFHFNFEHGDQSKNYFKLTVINVFDDLKLRSLAEQEQKVVFGSMKYLGLGTGGLNKPPNA